MAVRRNASERQFKGHMPKLPHRKRHVILFSIYAFVFFKFLINCARIVAAAKTQVNLIIAGMVESGRHLLELTSDFFVNEYGQEQS